jgi:hypothetical protein
MKIVVIAALVFSSISLAGCFEATSYGSAASDRSIPTRLPPGLQDCVHVAFPQCSGG